MKITSCGMTDVGKKRVHNEDNYLINDELQLFVVCDGMGGHVGGEIASAIAVHSIEEAFSLITWEQSGDMKQKAQEHMRSVIQLAGKNIFEEANRERRYKGMGTTCVATYVQDGYAFVAHVGDSRGYLIRGNRIEQLTEDHSLVNERIRAGMLTVEEAKNFRLKNVITRSLGFDNEVEVDVSPVELQKGDVILMCSDGLCNLVSAADMAKAVIEHPLQAAARSLIHQACDAGGDDNITVVLVRVDEL